MSSPGPTVLAMVSARPNLHEKPILHEKTGMKLRYIVLRLVKMVLVVIAVVLLSFFLIRLAPGDAATVMAGQSGYADEAFMKDLRAEYGLDQPLPVQLWKYVDAVAHGDLGTSYVRRQPVLTVILERLPNTLLL